MAAPTRTETGQRHDVAARRFALVPHPKPACRPLTERVDRVVRLAKPPGCRRPACPARHRVLQAGRPARLGAACTPVAGDGQACAWRHSAAPLGALLSRDVLTDEASEHPPRWSSDLVRSGLLDRLGEPVGNVAFAGELEVKRPCTEGPPGQSSNGPCRASLSYVLTRQLGSGGILHPADYCQTNLQLG
jgi:hypothetical protein